MLLYSHKRKRKGYNKIPEEFRKVSAYTVAHELHRESFDKEMLLKALEWQKPWVDDSRKQCKRNACRLLSYNNGLCLLHNHLEKLGRNNEQREIQLG